MSIDVAQIGAQTELSGILGTRLRLPLAAVGAGTGALALAVYLAVWAATFGLDALIARPVWLGLAADAGLIAQLAIAFVAGLWVRRGSARDMIKLADEGALRGENICAAIARAVNVPARRRRPVALVLGLAASSFFTALNMLGGVPDTAPQIALAAM